MAASHANFQEAWSTDILELMYRVTTF